jgi:GT2 family glycosyltransferase
MKAYTSISLHKIDPSTGLVTDVRESRLFYKNYPVFAQLPEAAQTQEAAIEHRNYWQTVKAKITIITVVHNQLQHTKAFINSLRRFTVNPLQIIVVNNASTDGTSLWLCGQAADGICVLNEETNLGWVGGINKGLDYVDTDSDYVIFANNDVIVESAGWERRLLSHFDSTVGAVGPISNYVAGRQNRVFDHPGITEEETNFLIGFFMCVRKGVIEEAGLLEDLHSFQKDEFRLSGGDDLDYSIRIRKLGYRLLIARDVFVYHAGSQSIKAKLTDQEYTKLCDDSNEVLKEKWGAGIFEDLLALPTRVLCAIPMRGDQLHRKFAFPFATMIKPFHFEVADIVRAHVESSRNAAVRFARENGFTHLLFLDDDHILPPDLFLRLYAVGEPVACALAFQRVPPYGPCVYRWGIGGEGQIGAFQCPEFIKTGVRKVDASGFSAVLIRMDVFTKLEEKKLPWFKWGELGEDLQFCLSCRDAGIDIYCDTDLILPHLGENLEVTEETYFTFNPQSKAAK